MVAAGATKSASERGPEPPATESSRRRTIAVIAVALLLVSEYILLSFLFDGEHLAAQAGWTRAIGAAGWVGPLLLIVPTAALLLQRQGIAGAWRDAAAHRASLTTAIIFGAAHLIAFAALLPITDRMLSTPSLSSALAVSWIALVIAWLIFAALVAVPPSALMRFARGAAGPIVLSAAVGVAAWLAGLATETLYEPLSQQTLRVAHGLLAVVADDAFMDAELVTLGTDAFYVEIAPSCSGYEGIGLIAVFMSAFLWLSRAQLRPRAVLLIPLAIAAVWLLNAARLAALVLVGDRLSPDIAAAGFHSKAGWLAVCAVALLGAVAARRWRFFARNPAVGGEETENPTAAYLVPLLALIACALVSGAVVAGSFDRLYGVRIVAAIAALYAVRAAHRGHLADYRVTVGPVVLGALAFALWLALEPASSAAAGATLRSELDAAGAVGVVWIATRALGSIFVVPVVEELAFRGFALRRLVSADFESVDPRRLAPVALIVSSLAFGLLHQRWLAGTLAGLIYAAAYYRRGRLADAVVAHGVTNALVAVWVLGFDRWELWA